MDNVEKAFCELFDKAEKVRHWGCTQGGGMIVSQKSVFDLVDELNKYRKLRVELEKK